MVTVDVIRREGKPPRKVYSITQAGRHTLQQWINQPIEPGASLKAFLMRLMLASNLSRTGLIAYLEQRHSQVAGHRAALEQATEAQDETLGLGQRLVFDYGLAAAAAELAWLERTLDRLSRQPLALEVAKGDGAPATV
jgi:hypothetical protein